MALRLTDVLGAVGAFAGRVPPEPPAGRFARPPVPADVAAALAGLPRSLRGRVLDPLARAERAPAVGRPRALRLPAAGAAAPAARQVDESTCGSAVLAMLLLAGDPRRALELARWPGGPTTGFAALQRSLKERTNRGPLGLRTWPDALGTPPWGAARVARYGPVRYAHRVVGGRRAPAVLAAALASARAGVPVPLFSGGDLGGGAAAAVPRHVVLLTSAGDGTARLYEPSSGRLHAVPERALLGRGDEAAAERAALTAALGGWPHVVWALLPRDANGGRRPLA